MWIPVHAERVENECREISDYQKQKTKNINYKM